MNTTRKISILTLMLLILVSCMGCSSQPDLSEITVTYVKSPLNVPSMVEKDQQIFARHMDPLGIQVNYAEITSGSEQVQALASGDVQFLYCVGATSVIIGKSNGADIEVLNMYGASPEAYQLLTSDPGIKRAEDLRGKRIGGPKGTTLHELLSAYLTKSGMSLDDIEYVVLSVADAFAALEAGHIDAAMLAGPTAYRAAQAGYTRLTNGLGLTNGATLVATSSDFAARYPEVVEAFRTAEEEVLAFIRDNPKQTREIVARESGLSPEAVDVMYPQYQFYLEPSAEDQAGLEQTAQFLQDTGMIEKNPKILLK